MGRYTGDLNWLTARPIAHRGYHDMNNTVWENTLSAFDRAIAHDFSIECDLGLHFTMRKLRSDATLS